MKTLDQVVQEATTQELQINGIDKKTLVDLLQDALAEEFNQWYMYTIVAPYLVGPKRINTVKIYEEQAEDELKDHAYWLMERINQLGATPNKIWSPDDWDKVATHKYIVPNDSCDVVENIKQNIESEKGAIETYAKLEKLTRDKDVVTNNKMKEILADEQEHLQNLEDILADIKNS